MWGGAIGIRGEQGTVHQGGVCGALNFYLLFKNILRIFALSLLIAIFN
jgi:hypothetical protein